MVEPLTARSGAYTFSRSVAGEAGQGQAGRPGRGDRQRVGALTATTAPKPAAQAFCTISKLARPLTNRPEPARRQPPSSSSRPTTLSTALWRPTSSRTTSGVAGRVEGGGGVHRAGGANSAWPRAHRVGHLGQHVEVERAGVAAAARSRARELGRAPAVPHSPHDDVVVVRRGAGAGRRAPGLDA